MMVIEDKQEILDSDDLDLLKEIMNIAFGQAAADLAKSINLFVKLSVPDIKQISINEISPTLTSELKSFNQNVSVVQQEFWGDLSGSAVLFFPAETENELVSLMGNSELSVDFDEVSTSLAQETLMELGNILNGACTGRIASLLDTSLSYSPPFAMINEPLDDAIKELEFHESDQVLVLQTSFGFEEQNLSGILLIAEQTASMAWMKKALQKFMNQYV